MKNNAVNYLMIKNISISVCILVICCGTPCLLTAQQYAFPGAEGAGRYTTGGRGAALIPSKVFEVTNLEDNNIAGTLRYALSQSATYRTVVFKVSGTIHLNSKLSIRSNTTVAGQTAPGDGICLADYPVNISGDNVIVRYLRFRMGDKNQNTGMTDGAGSDDAFGNLKGKNIIIDHCTASWSTDEALTVYRGDSVTVQWCYITEPLNYSYHFEAGDTGFEHHGFGGIWGAQHGSFHHNLIAHCKGRLPRFSGCSTYSPATAGVENVDFRNNVIYDWTSYSTNGGEGGNYNVVNNYYKYGPTTSSGNSSGIPVKSEIMNPSKSATLPYPKIFLSGNYVDGFPATTANNWKGIAMSGGTLTDTILSKTTSPFNILPIIDESAADAYERVLKFAGCSLPARDSLDQRIEKDVRNRTGTVIDVQGGFPHGTAYEQTINAWPVLHTTTAPADTDHDGMPDAWETLHGLNLNDPADQSAIAPDGYTNLEIYLNSLANDAVDIQGYFSTFLQELGTPSQHQHCTILAAHLTDKIIIAAPPGFQLSLNENTSWSSDSIELTPLSGSVQQVIFYVRLNAAQTGNYNGNIELKSGSTIYQQPVTGKVSKAGTTVVTADSSLLYVYPNPCNGKVTVTHPVWGDTCPLQINDTVGKTMLTTFAASGESLTHLNLTTFPSGVYVLRYFGKKGVLAKTIVK